jgi:hypothetical protein
LVTDRYPFFFDTYTNVVHDAENKRNGVWPRVQSAGENKTREKNHGSWRVVCREKKKRRGEQDLVSVTARDQEHVRLAGGSWLVLICSERKVLLTGYGWLVCSERKVLLAGG